MRTLFRIWPMVSAMTLALPGSALAQGAAQFDGTYAGVSIQTSGGRSCTAGPVPWPLTISGGNAQTRAGLGGDVTFQGPVGPQGTLTMHSARGTIISGSVDAGGNARGQLVLPSCTYQMVWRKK